MIELLGIIASCILLISMCVKSASVKGNILMRLINIGGSILMCIYGMYLSAFSVVFLNCLVIIIHIIHIIKILNKEK